MKLNPVVFKNTVEFEIRRYNKGWNLWFVRKDGSLGLCDDDFKNNKTPTEIAGNVSPKTHLTIIDRNGDTYEFFITKDGTLYSNRYYWGWTRSKIAVNVRSVSAAPSYLVYVTQNGMALWQGFGSQYSSRYQVGTDKADTIGTNVVSARAGPDYAMLIKENGTLWRIDVVPDASPYQVKIPDTPIAALVEGEK